MDKYKSQGYDEKSLRAFGIIFQIDLEEEEQKINFKQFFNMMTDSLTDQSTRDDLEGMFRLVDSSNAGYITLETLKSMAIEAGDSPTDADLQESIILKIKI